MIPIFTTASAKGKPSQALKEVPRKTGESNMAWLERNLKGEKDGVRLVLLGGRNLTGFRLRIAQAHVRHDFTPSWWSHVALLVETARTLGASQAYEISLEPPQGFGSAPSTNGVQVVSLNRYDDAKAFPNIGVIKIAAVSKQAILDALEQFQRQRTVLDALELVLKWQGYTWGVGRTGNPLLDGQGIPSAAMMDVVFSAAGFELTPGLESRSSCPEAIWQAAKWWHQYYAREKQANVPQGSYCVSHAFFPPED